MLTLPRPKSWAVWNLPRVAIGYILGVCLLAVTACVLWIPQSFIPTNGQLFIFATLIALCVFHTEATKRVEQTRRFLADTPHINLSAIWIFAGTLLLPASLAVALGITLYTYLYLRIWRSMRKMAVHRVLFNLAMITTCATLTQGLVRLTFPGQIRDNAVLSTSTDTVVAVFSVAVFILANTVLVSGIIATTSTETKYRWLYANWSDPGLDLTNLIVGACYSYLLLNGLVIAPLLLVPPIILHRSVLARQMEDLASTDAKTGLQNAAAWHDAANRELERASRQQTPFGVLMVDLDFFKRVNDTWGHLAGDEVLKAIAKILQSEIRAYDTAGRFGGEEFAVLIPDAPPVDAVATAERIRRRVDEMVVVAPDKDGGTVRIDTLTASVGVAVFPRSGDTVERLLLTADNALYVAKNSGRDQVIAINTAGEPLLPTEGRDDHAA